MLKQITDLFLFIRFHRNNDSKIILGGPHITLINAAWKSCKTESAKNELDKLLSIADNLVAGDGETGIIEALKAPSGTIIDADDHTSEMFMSAGQLNALPLPAWHLIDMGSYKYSIDGHK